MEKTYTIIKKRIIFVICAVFITEIFVVNHAFWSSKFISSPEKLLICKDENGNTYKYGNPLHLTSSSSLNIFGIDMDISSLKIQLRSVQKDGWTKKEENIYDTITCTIQITDEGHTNPYTLPSRRICTSFDSSKFFSMQPYGNIHSIQLLFNQDVDKIIVIDGIYANNKAAFNFSSCRFLIYLTLGILVLITFDSNLNNIQYDKNSKTQTKLTIFIGLLVCSFIILIQSQVSHLGDSHYKDLANALLEGRLYICENTDEILSSLSNPYDRILRDASGAKALWDYAYYNGKYYIYFGIIPALIFYLPYQLITSTPMSDFAVHIILVTLMVIEGFLLVKLFIDKYYVKLSYISYLLISIVFAIQSGTIFMIKRASVYTVAYGTGFILAIGGLIFWLSATSKEKPSSFKTAMGSFLLALSVGSRPQFVFLSLLAFPLYWKYFEKWKQNLKLICAGIIPYVPVACFLMLYNYLRFGSITDFGANYQITPHDMTHMGTHISRIGIGIWYYLFNLPTIRPEFPYLLGQRISTLYQGELYNETGIGGIFMLVPFCTIALIGINKWHLLKQEKVLSIYSITFIFTFLIAIMNVLSCGIVTRYQIDIRIYLLIATLMVVIAISNYYNHSIYSLAITKIVNLLCTLSLFMALFTLFATYESPDYVSVNPHFLSYLNYLFGIFDL